jgi:hypothetical protein
MLHLSKRFGRFDYAAQTLVVELVGGGPSGSPSENRANGDYVIFVLNILVDDVVGKAGERESSA